MKLDVETVAMKWMDKDDVGLVLKVEMDLVADGSGICMINQKIPKLPENLRN